MTRNKNENTKANAAKQYKQEEGVKKVCLRA
ncbi:MAG: hypothetical protein BWY69_00097 [Planctomycetes bacterium ADurb.Bin401]|nr:MAG: hypothetical protein BWY69_00097 [Planctomycetes bacterium ADurb.Bin401]